MRHLRRLRCRVDGYEPGPEEATCPVCHDTQWIWHCDRHSRPALGELGCPDCGFRFNGETYFLASDLAAALAVQWEQAREEGVSQTLVNWVESGLEDGELARRLKLLGDKAPLDPDARLTVTLAYLDPASPLRWRGRILSQMDFLAKGQPGEFADADLANSILGSAVDRWVAGHATASWLETIGQRCKERAASLDLTDLKTVSREQWWWLLAQPSALHEAATKVKERYVSSKSARVSVLFSKKDLTEEEALRLAVAAPEDLLTVATAWAELVKLVLRSMTDLESRARRKPITLNELGTLEREMEEVLKLLHKQREELRPRQAQLTEPSELLEATRAVRAALREGSKAHELVRKSIEQVRLRMTKGHVRRGVQMAAKLRSVVADYSDLNLDFVVDAEVQYKRQVRRLKVLVASITAGLILVAIALKIFWK